MSMLFSRRTFIRSNVLAGGILPVGLASLLGKTDLVSASTGPVSPRVKSCILIFYYGGPSHLDTWDMKPDAPAEIRGPFRPIATKVPGLVVGEHLPNCAKVMDKVSIIRSMHHGMKNHNSAAVEALCGRTPLRGDLELLSDDELSFPCYGALFEYLNSDQGRELSAVALPHVMRNVVRLPGQDAGLLGRSYSPFQIEADPSLPDFRVNAIDLPSEISADRFDGRQSLLEKLATGPASNGRDPMLAYYQRAFGLIRSPRLRSSLDLNRESASVRDRFGRHKLGQSLLLARRLVEAEVPFVTVYDGVHNGQDVNWDSHAKVFDRLQNHLLPPADESLAALLVDLDERGLLDSTLVIAMGEFGRTPKINQSAGRDHWPDCYSVLLAGGGIKKGYIHGESDHWGAYPERDPVTPGDLAATIFWAFGIDPQKEMHDKTGRPFSLAAGQPILSLFDRG
ncbi:DUF1501 domain-containing protein [bacterium]|nr:DUF1501 domain-containing protein [bacterium]